MIPLQPSKPVTSITVPPKQSSIVNYRLVPLPKSWQCKSDRKIVELVHNGGIENVVHSYIFNHENDFVKESTNHAIESWYGEPDQEAMDELPPSTQTSNEYVSTRRRSSRERRVPTWFTF